MKLTHTDPRTRGTISFIQQEPAFDQLRHPPEKRFTIALNAGADQRVWIDEVSYVFPSGNLLTLFAHQTFRFEKPEQITAWQYNREFYCIIDHDREVGCAGFLFFGSFGHLFIRLDDAHQRKLDILRSIFIEEFHTTDAIQTDMLQMLLKRLIIITTRLAKEQHWTDSPGDTRLEMIRQFNLLVEIHYKNHHQVQFYADALNKSPKTLANAFAQAGHPSPMSVIHERITREARRLLHYSDYSAKEIAYQLGFEDAAHFSRFFKNSTGGSISDFRKNQPEEAGNNAGPSVG